MTTITIPINETLNDFIEEQVRTGNASSKADLVRRAIQRLKEDEFVRTVLNARKEIREGKALSGDLDELSKGFE
jgi:Arc/MetJ-type ribon-helix-helix transcriptional regulator